jgi:hypothetical protein
MRAFFHACLEIPLQKGVCISLLLFSFFFQISLLFRGIFLHSALEKEKFLSITRLFGCLADYINSFLLYLAYSTLM